MTKKECAIVMAYTGITMLSGEDFQIYHKYIEDIMGRPVWTHELANESVVKEIKEKSKYDFLKLCEKAKYNDLTPMHQEPKTGHWIEQEVFERDAGNIEEWQSARCDKCKKYLTTPYMYYFNDYDYCPNCGAKMVKPQKRSDKE